MRKDMDKIIFEERAEIHAIAHALSEWQEKQVKKDKTVEELLDKLDIMDMEW